MLLGSILLATALVGFISFIAILVFSSRFDIKKITFYFLSLASGTMLGSALLDLMPEALESNPARALVLTCAGVLFFFVLEKLLIWRHCHMHAYPDDHGRPIAANMVIVGDAIHNFIDGAIIATSFLASVPVGVSVTAAIILHEIPQEIGDFAILVHGGYSIRRALWLNAITATAALAGATATYFFLQSMPAFQSMLIPFTAGGFLYIALADLIPQLHEQVAIRHTAWQIVLLAAGVGLTYLMAGHGH